MQISPVSRKISKSIAHYIEHNKSAQKILEKTNENPMLVQGITAFLLASFLRPLAILAMPTKSKADNRYSAIRSCISGALDLATSLLVFIPLNKVLQKSSKYLKELPNSVYKNKAALDSFNNLTSRCVKFAVLPIVSYLNFKYLKQIADKIGNKNANK